MKIKTTPDRRKVVFDYYGQTVAIEYSFRQTERLAAGYRAVLSTPGGAQNVEALITFLTGIILSWDLENENGLMPINKESFDGLSLDLVDRIAVEIAGDVVAAQEEIRPSSSVN